MFLVDSIVVCFGLVFIGSGARYIRRALLIRTDGIRCDGVVAGRTAGSAGGGWFPLIEYTTTDGHRLFFTSWVHWPAFVLPIHKRVPVRYRASNKADAVVDTLVGTWGQGVGSLLFGVGVLLLGLLG
jgi:hypothetical protein